MSFKFGDESANLDFSVGGDDGAASEKATPAPRATPSVPSAPTRIPGPPPRMPKAPLPAARPLPATPLPAPAAPTRQPEPVYEQPEAEDDQWDGYEEEVPVEQPRQEAPTPREPSPSRRPARSFEDAVEAKTPARTPQARPVLDDEYEDEEDAYYEEEPQPRRKPRPAPQAREEHVATKGRGKKTFASPAKKKAAKGPKGPSDWSGGRRKVLIARIVIFSLLALVLFAGVRSFLPQASTLTPNDQATVISNVRMELGITDFPATTGESVALGFSESYLSYGVNSREQRETQLLRYVPEEILNSIDVRFASEGDLAEAEAPVAPVGDPAAPGAEEGDDIEPDVQTVTGGPYVMGRTMVAGGKSAVYTIATEVNDNSWIYMQVPLFYDADTNSVSVSGSPSFTDGPKAGPVPNDLFQTEWSDDPEVEDAIEADIPNYFRAWGASDTAAIERLVLKKEGKIAASENAIRGLNGALRLVRVDDIRVESKPRPEDGASQEEIADFRSREARVTVTWLEPSSNLVYSQTYAMKLAYTNENWFIEDVENQGVTLGQSRERL